MVATVCERYHLSPQQVADMTPDQLLALAGNDPRPGALPAGKSAEQARAELRRKQGKPV